MGGRQAQRAQVSMDVAAQFFDKWFFRLTSFEYNNIISVDGRNPAPVDVGSLSYYWQGFRHPRWLFRIFSINSSSFL